MTFGDNTTRDCLSNCTNDEFGDPTSRSCLTQCPDDGDQSGSITENYYGDKSTGVNLCVAVCPSTPVLFG
jgi:Na+-translocating ferredoxin:NAD+ oxidoreductase RNF subunit RnfB